MAVEWASTVNKKCTRHGRRMVIAKYGDDEPKRVGRLIMVKCPEPGCIETSTVSEADARSDID